MDATNLEEKYKKLAAEYSKVIENSFSNWIFGKIKILFLYSYAIAESTGWSIEACGGRRAKQKCNTAGSG